MLFVMIYMHSCIHCRYYSRGTVINFSTAPTMVGDRIEICRYQVSNELKHDTSVAYCSKFERKVK